MTTTTLRRRLFLLGGLSFACGCKRSAALPASCEDPKALTDQARTARTALAYDEHPAGSDKACLACQQWVSAKEDGGCGGCKLLEGPIHPKGTCKAFAPRG